jgi:hypothetical protein
MSAHAVPNLGDSGLVPPQGLSKAEQLVQNVFAKTAQIVVGSRFGLIPGDESLMRSGKKLNKWVSPKLNALDARLMTLKSLI